MPRCCGGRMKISEITESLEAKKSGAQARPFLLASLGKTKT